MVPAPLPHTVRSDSTVEDSGRIEQRWRVLVVNNGFVDRLSMKRILERQGHSVMTVSDGEEALSAAGAFLPQVILLDIDLPGLDGYDVCAGIRAEPWSKRASIFAITGVNRHENLPRAQASGFDGCLSKPINSEVLARALAILHEPDRAAAPELRRPPPRAS